MKKGYIKIHLPKNDIIVRTLDVMMELGQISAVEESNNTLIVLDTWQNRNNLRKIIRDAFPEGEWTETYLKEQDWNQKWIDGFQPIPIHDTLWITPPWHAHKIAKNHEKIIINPGNAFGTGTHESTRLALELMSCLIRPGDKVLDLGCGSGILSIAARKMGASVVHAIDNDPEIAHNLSENIKNNHITKITWEIIDILQMNNFGCDLAVINIQKHVILPLLARFNVAKEIPNRVILAGLLKEHRGDIEFALEKQAYTVIDTSQMNEWIAIAAVKRSINET